MDNYQVIISICHTYSTFVADFLICWQNLLLVYWSRQLSTLELSRDIILWDLVMLVYLKAAEHFQ